MGRPERPVDPTAGPVESLAWELRQLRGKAGRPSYRRLALRAHFSASTLAEAAKGERLPSLEVTLAYVRACGGDVAEWAARWRAAAVAQATSDSEPAGQEPEQSPYLGLPAFQPEQAELFFGRSRLIDRLREQVEHHPFVAVFGASGTGKSSLLRAGLVGRIARDPDATAQWRTVLMTPTQDPLGALSGQIARLSGVDPQELRAGLAVDPAALDVAIRNSLTAGPEETRVLLVVDQFEEIFTLCGEEGERDRFIAALLDAAYGPGRRTTVVLGMRADFLAYLIRHPALADAVGADAQVLVGPMSAAELREAVVMPAAHAGVNVEPDLLAAVLADAADEPGALPLMSHAMLAAWLRHDGSALTLSDYHGAGGVRGAIAQTAEATFTGLPADRQGTARRIFLRLCTLGEGTEDTRRPISRAELDGLTDPEMITALLERLAAARLVVLGGDESVELAHEALIRAWPRLHRWLTDDRDSLFIHRRLTDAAQTWEELNRDEGALYRGTQLAVAATWADDHPREPNRLESAFLEASRARQDAEYSAAQRRARQLRRLLAAITVLLLIAVAGWVTATRRGAQTQRQQVITAARQLSLQARSLLATDPGLAGLLAVAAFRLHPDAETRGGVLSAAAAPRRTELHTGAVAVYDVAFSPDGSILAAADSRGRIGLWNPHTRTLIATLQGPGTYARRLAFSLDGKRLVTTAVGRTELTITVWDVPARRILARRAVKNASPRTLAFSPDGAKVAVGVQGGTFVVWNWTDGSFETRGHDALWISSLAFSPDGRLLVSAPHDKKVVIWDAATLQRRAEFSAGRVHTAVFDPTTGRLATASDPHGARLWEVSGASPRLLYALPAKPDYAWAVSAPIGDAFAVADENGDVTIWDTRRREILHSFHDRGLTETLTLALSTDGSMLASAGFGGSIVLRRPLLPPFTGHTTPVNDLRVSPDGKAIASAGDDGTVRLWDRNGRQTGILTGHSDQVQAIAFSGDGRLLAAVTRDHTITLWDPHRRRRLGPPIRYPGVGASTDIAINPSGTHVATAGLYRFLYDISRRDRPSEQQVDDDPRAQRIALSVAFSPNGRLLASGGAIGNLVIRDLATGKDRTLIPAGQGALQDVAFNPAGTLIATAGADRTIKLWDARDGRPAGTLTGHTRPVSALAFSPYGNRLASVGEDQTAIVWDLATRRPTAILTGHTAPLRGLAFTPDGALITAGDDHRVMRWTLDPQTAVASLCQGIGRDLTRQEWTTHTPSTPYRPTCPH